MAKTLPTVLEKIVSRRRTHLPALRQQLAHVTAASLQPSQRSLAASIRGSVGPAFIMECKAASPSLGTIRTAYNPAELATVYSRYAAGISVLCEPEFFNGHYDHLATVAATTHLPVLCKDFIIDPVQVLAARYYGADAILLMLSVLDDAAYQELAALAAQLQLDVLTEVIDAAEVARAVRLGAQIVGINHRNLHDLSIDLNRSARLAALLPPEVLVVSESGIKDHATVRQLAAHSDGFLVGSHLSGQEDVDHAARELLYGSVKVCGLTSARQAQAAAALGASYGGVILEPASPRNVSRETAASIIAAAPGLKMVAVSRRRTGWEELAQLPGLFAIQVHAPWQGSLAAELELLQELRDLIARTGNAEKAGAPLQLWRAVNMQDTAQVEHLAEIAAAVDKVVLDNGAGGTGESFDWGKIPAMVKAKALLAGGIGPGNVTAAAAVGAWGIDLNSGLEYRETTTAQPEKDPHVMAETLRLLRVAGGSADPQSTDFFGERNTDDTV